MTRTGAVHVVVHGASDRMNKRLRRLNDPRRGRLQLEFYDTDKVSVFDVAEAVIDALTDSLGLYSVKRSVEPLAAARLLVEGPFEVVIPDAQLLPPPDAVAAAQWLTGFGADVWFCCSTRSPQLPDQRIRWLRDHLTRFVGADEYDEDEFNARFKPARPLSITPDPWPIVPRVDGVLFRSACRDELSDEDFAVVDAEFVASVRRIRAAVPVPGDEAARQREHHPVLLRELDTATSLEHVLIRVRAAQVAFLTRGWHLDANIALAIGAAHRAPRTAQLTATGAWDKLAFFRDPDPGAAASLYVGRLDGLAIRSLTVDDIDLSGDRDDPFLFRTDAGDLIIDNPGVRFVRTLATFHQLAGSDPDTLLFRTNQRKVSPRQLGQLLRIPMAEVGVSGVRGDRVYAKHFTPAQTVGSYGLTLDWVGEAS